MKLSKYGSLIKGGIIEQLQFRTSAILVVVCNLLYLLLIYFLWKAIYASAGTDVVNGMTFSDTMIYLVFASALFNFMEMWIAWNMGSDIRDGRIIIDLLRPIPYPLYLFCALSGNCIVKFVTTFMPTAVVVYFVVGGEIHLGWNILWFVLSASISLVINYFINLFVGTICMYTESIWGINIMKEVVVGILSGATIPLVFFPDTIRTIVMYLPFQAIINSPLELLLHTEYSLGQIGEIIGLQVVWLIVIGLLCNAFFNLSVRRITVNGG
ncbi:MAG: ABC-2 family transporter protein [Lachnospiraceae bacterium]|nr:ABC-2 family transporter protein [Lachnospiraceae bacterium]